MSKEYKFPLVFDRCPNCDCEDTIIRVALQEYVDKGKASMDKYTAIYRIVTQLLTPDQTILTMPQTVSILDGCPECGTVYFTRVEKMDVPVTTQFGGKQGPPGIFPIRGG